MTARAGMADDGGGMLWEAGMKTRAAALRDLGKDWEVIEPDLDPPREGEVLIRFAAAGLCHSDDHLRTGDIPVRHPRPHDPRVVGPAGPRRCGIVAMMPHRRGHERRGTETGGV